MWIYFQIVNNFKLHVKKKRMKQYQLFKMYTFTFFRMTCSQTSFFFLKPRQLVVESMS